MFRSSLLVVSYEEKDKFTAQGLNDFIVFSTQGIGALSAGFLLGYQLENTSSTYFVFHFDNCYIVSFDPKSI